MSGRSRNSARHRLVVECSTTPGVTLGTRMTLGWRQSTFMTLKSHKSLDHDQVYVYLLFTITYLFVYYLFVVTFLDDEKNL